MARTPKQIAPPPMPEMPPLSAKELAAERYIIVQLEGLTARLRQRNLDTAVLLAQQAARGQGPLIDHFQELGRRYAAGLNGPAKPSLRLVKDGAA